MTQTDTPEELDISDIHRILVVVAHPDDAEYGTSAAVAAWSEAGIDVGYLLLSSGEAGMSNTPPEQAGPLRAAEQRAACNEVGVNHLTISDFPDGIIEYGLKLRAVIAREIRSFRPDLVIATSFELTPGWGINHSDHRAVGLATLDATRDAANRWVFTEILGDLEPWEISQLLVANGTPHYYVPLTDDHVKKAIASLAAHKEYLAAIPWHPAPEDFIPGILSGLADTVGIPYAMGFNDPART